MDLPNREEIVKRIRQLTGQRDPDAGEPTPEEMQAAQAAQQQQALQQEAAALNLRQMAATVQKTEAEAAKLGAQLEELRSKVIAGNVATQKDAVVTAQQVAAAPGLVPVADTILNEAGFVSVPEQQETAARAAALAAQQQQAPVAPQPQPGA
jgi:hypothetical protein